MTDDMKNKKIIEVHYDVPNDHTVYIPTIWIVRQTFEERYNNYVKDYEKSLSYMNERLKHMSKEELAYLLAEHDKFLDRSSCAEYKSDDDVKCTVKFCDSEGHCSEHTYGTETEKLPDPLGRKFVKGKLTAPDFSNK